MLTIQDHLITLGFSEKYANIYLAILELGEASVIEIAQKAGLKRTTVYNILPDLLHRGLIKVTIKKGRRLFLIENVNPLKAELEERVRLADNILPELRAVQNILPLKPRITFY